MWKDGNRITFKTYRRQEIMTIKAEINNEDKSRSQDRLGRIKIFKKSIRSQKTCRFR